ncbi:MAG: ATP-binding protein [Phycisphaerae bacterium]|jgi:signal transduction histidine kinase
MGQGLWLIAAALGGLLAGVAVTLWAGRRLWTNVRRLSARAKGAEHLVELGQLAGGLAHEIKNPLSTINVNLKLLSEDLQRYSDEDHRRWLRRLDSVQGETARLREILDDFLRFAGKYEITLTVVDLRQTLGELADFFGPQAETGHVIMRTSLPETPVRCNIDENLIKQALLNLMLNAVQAMSEGGELLIKLTPSRGRAIIEVIDTGPGIAPDDIPKVFQVYYSTKKRGTGLGLPTTRRIIREHEGTIRVESEVGKGTRFIIALPLAKGGA